MQVGALVSSMHNVVYKNQVVSVLPNRISLEFNIDTVLTERICVAVPYSNRQKIPGHPSGFSLFNNF